MQEVTLVIILQTLFLILSLWLSLLQVTPGSEPLCVRWFPSNHPHHGAQHTWLLWPKLFMTNVCSIYVNLSSTVLWGHELNSIALNLGCWKQSTMALQTIKRLDFCTCAFLLVWGLVITPSDSPRCIIHAGIHRKSLACGDGWGRLHKRIFDLVINTTSWKSSAAG